MAAILVVEDNSALRLAYRMLLKNAGHAVTEAAQGQQALTLLAAARFDLVITDLFMPGIDGFAVIAAAKRINPHGMVLAVTGGILGTGADDPAVRAKRAGADAVIEKPMLGEGFIGTVDALLEAGCDLDGQIP